MAPPRLRRGSLALVPSLPIPSPSASFHNPSRRFDPSSSYRIVAQHRKKLLRFPSVPFGACVAGPTGLDVAYSRDGICTMAWRAWLRRRLGPGGGG